MERLLAHWYAMGKCCLKKHPYFDLEITANNTTSAAGIPVKFLLSLEGFLGRNIFDHSQAVFEVEIYRWYAKKSSFKPIKCGDPRYFVRSLKIFNELVGFFTSKKVSLNKARLARGVGRFRPVESTEFPGGSNFAGSKEKGDLEVSGWGFWVVGCEAMHSKFQMEISVSFPKIKSFWSRIFLDSQVLKRNQ